MHEGTGTSGIKSRGLPLTLGNILTVWRKVLVTMATWEFIWRESCDWRLSHCKRLTSGDFFKKGSRLAGMKSHSISAGNTKRYAVEKVLYTGLNVVGAFLVMGCVLVGRNAAAGLLLLFTCITWVRKKKRCVNGFQ